MWIYFWLSSKNIYLLFIWNSKLTGYAVSVTSSPLIQCLCLYPLTPWHRAWHLHRVPGWWRYLPSSSLGDKCSCPLTRAPPTLSPDPPLPSPAISPGSWSCLSPSPLPWSLSHVLSGLTGPTPDSWAGNPGFACDLLLPLCVHPSITHSL